MVKLKLIGHDFEYEINDILNLFIDKNDNVNYEIFSILDVTNNIVITTKILADEKLISEYRLTKEKYNISDEIVLKKRYKRLVKISLFRALNRVLDKNVPWGILTGIRPTKIVHDMLENGLNDSEILEKLEDEYEITKSKADLLINVAKNELDILNSLTKRSIGLYIGIPFCPTRCLYCSFTSNSLEKNKHLIDGYMSALIKEIDVVGNIIKNGNLEVGSIYIGGGTPTSINTHQIDILLSVLKTNFNFNKVKEITYEAGRPDTITKEKLNIIKQYGIDRIGINPQTMNDETLRLIKRMHISSDIRDKYYLAREQGFDNINMDVIAGLPGETEIHMTNTMNEILRLNPESVTVHTMAIKRASSLNEDINNYKLTHESTVNNMLDIAKSFCYKMNMEPYYLYRQKNMLGNFENVGYSKNGFECIYNIQIMEEKQSIIALGAGGISKIVYDNNRIERIFNVKNVEEYINRIDEMIERKMQIYEIN